jgi:hypothetical protein
MKEVSDAEGRTRSRNLLFLSDPRLWPVWPFLPLIRRHPDGDGYDCGLLFDAFHRSGRTGLSATVFIVNLFAVPATEEEFLAVPHEHYDTPAEVYAAGWRID